MKQMALRILNGCIPGPAFLLAALLAMPCFMAVQGMEGMPQRELESASLPDTAIWSIREVVFMDKEDSAIKASVKMVRNGKRWYYYHLDSKDEYKVMARIADGIFLHGVELAPDSISTFMFRGREARTELYRDYPGGEDSYDIAVFLVHGRSWRDFQERSAQQVIPAAPDGQ